MGDQWGDYKHRDKVRDGVIFYVKYLGSILVSELTEEGQSYGDGIGAEAVKTIVAMVCSVWYGFFATLAISPKLLWIMEDIAFQQETRSSS